MGDFPLVFAFAATLFCAFILNLATRPRVASRLATAAFFITGLGGLLCYGYGYAVECDNIPVAVLRAALSTAYTFMGKNDFSAVSKAPFFQTILGQSLFWAVHMVALYAIASAIFITAGAGILRRLRLLAALRGDLVLIYGTHSGAITFGRKMSQRRKTSVVFVDPTPAPGSEEAIRTMGAVLRSDSSAIDPDRRFLRSLGIRNLNHRLLRALGLRSARRVCLYALSRNSSANTQYAIKLLSALRAASIPADRTSLTMLGYEDNLRNHLLNGDSYGYGSVTVLDEAEIAARLLVLNAPPFRALTFDAEGCAQQDLHCLIVGFGRVGQAVLQNVTMNGQFAGNKFHAAVFAPDCNRVSGLLSVQAKGLIDEQYDIRFFDCDARSRRMYDYLDQQGRAINYVAICTGDDTLNREIAEDLLHYFSRRGHDIPVCLCSRSGVQQMRAKGETKQWALYSPDILCTDTLDRKARLLNHIYCDNDLTEEENWNRCNYFNRMSSRAAADFSPAFMHMAGMTAQDVQRDGWDPQGPLLENLAQTEHLRWCAFHYAMGFSQMDPQTHLQRATAYAAEKAAHGESDLRISRDLERRLHACLIPWDQLDELSSAENAITGEDEDYQKKDRDNVRILADLLRIDEEATA